MITPNVSIPGVTGKDPSQEVAPVEAAGGKQPGQAAIARHEVPDVAETTGTGTAATPQPLATAAPEESLQQLQQALEKLSAPNASIDTYISDYSEILRYIGSVLIKNADAMRQSALSERMAAREAARSALLGQSEKLHEAAEKARTLAIICVVAVVALSVTSIAASAFSIRNAFREIKINQMKARDLALTDAEIKNLKSLKDQISDPETEQSLAARIAEAEARKDNIAKAAEEQIVPLRQRSRVADAVGQASVSGSNVLRSAEGIQQASIKATEADATLFAANAQYDQQHSDLKKDIYDRVRELAQQAISLHQHLLHSQAEAMRAITRS